MATSHARELLSKVPAEKWKSAIAATLKIATKEAKHHPDESMVDSFALFTIERGLEILSKDMLPDWLASARTFALLTIHFADQKEFLEALEAAWWMTHFETGRREGAEIIDRRRRASKAAKQRKTTHQKVSDERLLLEVRSLEERGMPERNRASRIQKALQINGIEISGEALRKRLKKLKRTKKSTT